jgi:hypothetical protein
MKTDFPIFDIPVYRCTLEEHTIEAEKTIDDKLDVMNPPLSDRERWKREFMLRYDDSQWMRWHYNQTVGWLQLCVSGSDVIATEYWVTAKRITSYLRHKTFIWNDYKAINVIVFPTMSDADIFSEVDKELLSLAKTKKYRNRFIDLTNFHNVGPFIRWRDLLNQK